ncbi:MAG: ABC transporter permease [Myxococcota bacterium]|nr:ABC transporter permease [Myxococcota bacterium]
MNVHLNLFQHVVRRSIRSIWENLYLNTVAAGVITASLLLLGVYTAGIINLNSIVDTWNKDIHISAYFQTDLSEQEHLELRDRVYTMPQTAQVRYVSQKEAQGWLTQRIDGIEDTLEALGEDALPASLEITLRKEASQPKQIEAFAEALRSEPFEDIDYGVEWVEKFNAFLQLLKMLGVLLGSLILISATFLVTNTVHLIVYNRRHEMEIAKLVGASNHFIIWPFLFEGVVQGLIGALCAITGLWIIHRTLTIRLQEALGLELAGELHFLSTQELLLLGLIGIGLGVLAAFIASQRFIRQAP